MKNLERQNIEDILALTPMQEGMLFHYLKDHESDYYFEQLRLEISGAIDIESFEKAWNIVIKSNEALRTVFRWEKVEKPLQIILKEHPCDFRFHDLEAFELERFDLNRVPFRVSLRKIGDRKFEVIISNHHILYDGWSNGIILKEFFNAYHKLRSGEASITPPVKPPFKKFIDWLKNRNPLKQQEFWKGYLDGFEGQPEFPLKRREREGTKGVEDYKIVFEKDINDNLDIFVKNNRVTPASVLYSAWGILLRKYCNSGDVVFGTTVSGRPAGIKGIEEMVGLFINTIPLRAQTFPGVKIIDVVSGIDNALHAREEFEHTPLVDIRSDIASLFDTIVVIENYPLDNRLIPADSGLSIDSYSMSETVNYDLTVGITLFEGIDVEFTYKQGLFDKQTIENLGWHLKRIVRHIVEDPEQAVDEIEIISPEEKNRLLYDFNDTAAEYPKDKMFHELFEEQVECAPDRIAIIGRSRVVGEKHLQSLADANASPSQLSYRELNQESDRLAVRLRERDVQPDTVVAIMVGRSIDMVIGVLGILKAGGAFLPIDPGFPQERIDYMLKDSGAGIIVGNRLACTFLSSVPSVSSVAKHPGNLAYMIYHGAAQGSDCPA
jgi:hypothetical protein